MVGRTDDFVAGSHDWAVMVALVSGGVPVLSMWAPRLFTAVLVAGLRLAGLFSARLVE